MASRHGARACHVSILMPVYNGRRHVGQQISSILAQSFAAFELIIVDDGSTDNTLDQVASAIGSDERVIVLPSQGNRGQRSRLNELLGHASAGFVAFSDQDDIWHPDKIRHLVDGIGESALAHGPSELIDDDGRPQGVSIFDVLKIDPDPGFRLMRLFRPLISAHATLARRDSIDPSIFVRSEPFDWLLCLDATFSRGVTYVPKAITYHRIHRHNQSNSSMLEADMKESTGIKLPRAILKSGQYDRYEFTKRIEHIAFSSVTPSPVRAAVRRLVGECVRQWFISRRSLIGGTHDLRALMTDTLQPLAGSDADWRRCERMIDTLNSEWRQRRA